MQAFQQNARHGLEEFLHDHPVRISTAPLCPQIRLALIEADAASWTPLFGRDDGPKPYWGFAWASGQALARLILDRPWLVRGRTVLDFGAGSGIAAIAAAMAGARKVTACDVDPWAAEMVARNAHRNHVQVEVLQQDLLASADPGAEVVIAGDIFHNCRTWDLAWLFRWTLAKRQLLIATPPQRDFMSGLRPPLASCRARTHPAIEPTEIQEVLIYFLG